MLASSPRCGSPRRPAPAQVARIIFSGLALWILPQAGKQVPPALYMAYAGDVLGVPVVLLILVAAIALTAVA